MRVCTAAICADRSRRTLSTPRPRFARRQSGRRPRSTRLRERLRSWFLHPTPEEQQIRTRIAAVLRHLPPAAPARQSRSRLALEGAMAAGVSEDEPGMVDSRTAPCGIERSPLDATGGGLCRTLVQAPSSWIAGTTLTESQPGADEHPPRRGEADEGRVTDNIRALIHAKGVAS